MSCENREILVRIICGFSHTHTQTQSNVLTYCATKWMKIYSQ